METLEGKYTKYLDVITNENNPFLADNLGYGKLHAWDDDPSGIWISHRYLILYQGILYCKDGLVMMKKHKWRTIFESCEHLVQLPDSFQVFFPRSSRWTTCIYLLCKINDHSILRFQFYLKISLNLCYENHLLGSRSRHERLTHLNFCLIWSKFWRFPAEFRDDSPSKSIS